MQTVPVRTLEQRQEAIAKAVASRRERLELRRALNRGELTPAGWFRLADEEPRGVAAMTRVVDMARAVPGHRRTERALDLLAAVGVGPRRRVRGLGWRQRDRLAREIERRLTAR